MSILQISPKGQILIPRKLRDKVGLKPGSSVQAIGEEHLLILIPVPEDPIGAATGFLGLEGSLTGDLLKEHRKEARRERKTRPR